MALRDPEIAYASVSHEFGAALLTSERATLTFGRSTSTDVTIGLQPVADPAVPRLAGRIVVVDDGRVLVENLGDVLAFDVVVEGETPAAVRPHAVYGAPGPRWSIRVAGAASTYTLAVEVLAEPATVPGLRTAAGDEPATILEPQLTTRQWRVLEAYTAPLKAGRVSPATHAQVAEALGWAKSTVRIECNAIWNSFLLAGVPMRDFHDKRDAIIDAATRHHLLPG